MEKYDIGSFVKFVRTNANLSQKELATKANLSQSSLSKLESGMRDPKLGEFLQILSSLNISTSDFFLKSRNLQKEMKDVENNYTKIMLHYGEYKNSKTELIHEELIYFKNIFQSFKINGIFDVRMDIRWYIQLPKIFPEYFQTPDTELLNKEIIHIFTQKEFYLTDYYFIANSLPFLYPATIEHIYTHIQNFNMFIPNAEIRRSYYTIFENLSDYFLINYQQYKQNDLQQRILTTFKFWKEFLQKYPNFTSEHLYQHNYAMYQFLFNLKTKEEIMIERELAWKDLIKYNHIQLKQDLERETRNYFDGLYGNLIISVIT